MAFGVKTRESSERWAVWIGGSSWIRVPAGISMSALIMSRRTPLRLENVVPIDEGVLDIVEPADGVEVVRLVVVERRLVPQRRNTGYGSSRISRSYGS